jgi:hypothetical protein
MGHRVVEFALQLFDNSMASRFDFEVSYQRLARFRDDTQKRYDHTEHALSEIGENLRYSDCGSDGAQCYCMASLLHLKMARNVLCLPSFVTGN